MGSFKHSKCILMRKVVWATEYTMYKHFHSESSVGNSVFDLTTNFAVQPTSPPLNCVFKEFDISADLRLVGFTL